MSGDTSSSVNTSNTAKTPCFDGGALLEAVHEGEELGDDAALDLAVGRPDRRRRELDNVNKVVLDLVQHIEVLEDDSLVHKLTSYWDENKVGVRVAIYPMDQADA